MDCLAAIVVTSCLEKQGMQEVAVNRAAGAASGKQAKCRWRGKEGWKESGDIDPDIVYETLLLGGPQWVLIIRDIKFRLCEKKRQ